MQLKQDASSRMQDQWNSSRRILCSSQSQFALPKFAMCWQPCENSQCQFRNANFAMQISQCQFCQFRNANFEMPISQCQFQIRNANTLFICLTNKTLAKFRIAKFANHIAKFRNPLPKFAISVGIAKFTAKFTGLVILCN